MWTEIDLRTMTVVSAVASGVEPVDLRERTVSEALSRPSDTDRVLRVVLAGVGTMAVGIAMRRDRSGFDDGDRELVARLRPLLGFAVREALAAPGRSRP